MSKAQLDREMISILNDPNRFEDAYRDLLMEETFNSDTVSCEVGIDTTCLRNEVCAPQHSKSRNGKLKYNLCKSDNCSYIFLRYLSM